MIWVLRLNDMRNSHAETLRPIASAVTREALKDFLERERVPAYDDKGDHPQHGRDYRFRKTFRKGSALEWYNEPTIDKECFIQVEEPNDAVERITAEFHKFTEGLIRL